MANDLEHERASRELRLQIGRLRRRIDGHLRAAGRETQRLTSWRTYVKSFPGCAVLAALGTGLVLSAGLTARRIARWLGLRLVGRAFDTAGHAVWRELEQIWAATANARKPGGTRGGDDGRA
jgi:hypothetical protein